MVIKPRLVLLLTPSRRLPFESLPVEPARQVTI